jgi:hypothetical protein
MAGHFGTSGTWQQPRPRGLLSYLEELGDAIDRTTPGQRVLGVFLALIAIALVGMGAWFLAKRQFPQPLLLQGSTAPAELPAAPFQTFAENPALKGAREKLGRDRGVMLKAEANYKSLRALKGKRRATKKQLKVAFLKVRFAQVALNRQVDALLRLENRTATATASSR